MRRFFVTFTLILGMLPLTAAATASGDVDQEFGSSSVSGTLGAQQDQATLLSLSI